MSGVEAVRMLFAGDAMVTQTVSVFDTWHSKVVLLDRAPSPTAVTPNHSFAISYRIRSVVIEKKVEGRHSRT